LSGLLHLVGTRDELPRLAENIQALEFGDAGIVEACDSGARSS
jgi:hypothetical protein